MKRILVALTVMIAATLVAATMASANGVPRYQMQTATLSFQLTSATTYTHTFTVTINPCDGSFSGNGTVTPGDKAETISGSMSGGNLTFTYAHVADTFYGVYPSVTKGTSFADVYSAPGTLYTIAPVTTPTITNYTDITNYKNHGAYVSQNPDKNDAAHSCLGMPMKP